MSQLQWKQITQLKMLIVGMCYAALQNLISTSVKIHSGLFVLCRNKTTRKYFPAILNIAAADFSL
ncbi:hypothetical protein T01_15706 [Trichinella spiralis]|uniref:Uncharacterized protein n=1 Tax=Trichinella spiralis TaxID=6334 RepID=A0A0V0Z6L5_TRISP|nr:hypothetical protein T01_15706 [Trichinella spiralis]